jgi:glycosyltransferase involved in cell wall biosynthesis
LKKVAHINLANGMRGGENQTLALLETLYSLQDNSFEHILVCRHDSMIETIAYSKGIKTLAIKKPFLFSTTRLKEFDFMHVHEGRSGLLALCVNYIYKVPYLITRRIPNMPRENYLTQLKYKKARLIVSLSHKIDEVMKSYQIKSEFKVIPSMARKLIADFEQVKLLKENYQDRFLIGHVGALSQHHKNQGLIIDAARKLQEEEKNIHFLLVGSGIDEAILKERAKGLDNITFVGQKKDIANYYALFDLFVYPSFEEGLGSSILEAFSFRLPVIAANRDGIPDIITHGENGYLVEPNDVDTFVRYILDIYENEEKREKLAEQAFESLENFSPLLLAGKYIDVYKKYFN